MTNTLCTKTRKKEKAVKREIGARWQIIRSRRRLWRLRRRERTRMRLLPTAPLTTLEAVAYDQRVPCQRRKGDWKRMLAMNVRL